jgi:hypothetical protein
MKKEGKCVIWICRLINFQEQFSEICTHHPKLNVHKSLNREWELNRTKNQSNLPHSFGVFTFYWHFQSNQSSVSEEKSKNIQSRSHSTPPRNIQKSRMPTLIYCSLRKLKTIKNIYLDPTKSIRELLEIERKQKAFKARISKKWNGR